jgi:hypothetical protein
VEDRSPTQRAGLPPKIDVQAYVKGSAEMHSPSLEHIAYQVNWKHRDQLRLALVTVRSLIDAESGDLGGRSPAVAR